MRKLIAIVSIFLIIFAFSFESAQAKTNKKKKPITKHKIEFTTKDKFILVGDLYIANPKTNKPLIVMLHSFSLNALHWKEPAQNLRSKGYNVLAMDLRGHARSVYRENLKIKSRYKFTNDDWAKLPGDVVESIAYIKANYPYINCDDIIILGADLGASAGVLAGEKTFKQPQKFVLISPMSDFKGLYIPIKLASFPNSRFLFLVSNTDKTSLLNLKQLLPFVQTKPVVIKYPYGGAGNQLLKVNPKSNDDIINFILN